MKNSKGFTLIELLAVVVILAVLGAIAIVSVNRVIDKVKTNAKEVSRRQVAKAAEACYIAENNEENCSNVDYLKSNGYLKSSEDEYKISFDENGNATVEDKTNPEVANNCTSFETKSTYSVGDVIALCNSSTGKSEDFYVISDNGETVTALAKYNLLVGNVYNVNSEELTQISSDIDGYGLQNSSAKGYNENSNIYTGVIAFSNENYWANNVSNYPSWVFNENSNLYNTLQDYKNYLKNTLNKSSVEVTLLDELQAENLGCNISTFSCSSAPLWVYSTSYWLGSVFDENRAILIVTVNVIGNEGHDYNIGMGIRPVITIAKSEL